jgi:hypothetical protein
MRAMQEYGKITTMEAFEYLGITRLSARIKDLRDSGVKISTNVIEVENRFGEKCRVAEYRLIA